MDEGTSEVESLTSRIEQLQRERDQLRKDIEQLCLQQAGPSYLAAATRMHFQRTAGLEQEIEGLKKQLAGCTREKQNLQEELSEAYRIKGQLADLHSTEVLKNKEADKQLKFYQNCVAAAFSERDNALMESEKAKEREEAASEKLIMAENRVEELQSAYQDEKKLNMNLQIEMKELKDQNDSFKKVVSKFYQILERETGAICDLSWVEKCSRLLDDPSDSWVFSSERKTSTVKYIASLEEELEKRKTSIDNLQSNLRMGLQIERHLKKNIQYLERKQIDLANTIKTGLSALRDFHNQRRSELVKILEEETSWMKLNLVEIQDKLNQIQMNNELKCEALLRGQQSDDVECRDVHTTSDVDSEVVAERTSPSTVAIPMDKTHDVSGTLAQALQEKVAALLLLSQQEEMHLLERDVNQALREKIEELQRNLSQVTSEKVHALMEVAELKREYHLLLERSNHVSKHVNSVADASTKDIAIHDQEGKLKNLLKRSYLKRWIGKGLNEQENVVHQSPDESSSIKKREISPADFARLQVENAAFQESMANLEHLTSSIHRLHAALLKARQNSASDCPLERVVETLRKVIREANLVKTALGTSLPVSWSADAAADAATYENLYEPADLTEAVKDRMIDPVSCAGLKMVELLILATQLLLDGLGTSHKD